MATERQGRVLALFYKYSFKAEKAPTLMEIARHLGARTKNGALTHVHVLWDRGYLYRPAPYVRRGYRLTKKGREEAKKWTSPPR